ncbi:MAG: hypothetical protein RBU25_14935 [Lentisphaeria bacterium]|jgi:3-hydroxyacyl-[acyl-carrier-protein] dehydratase|nr:hypothetical protein [Lentisphaeria bacterium]
MSLQAQLRSCASGPPTAAGDGSITQTFCLAAGLACYEGHFPGEPVTPAVVQVLLARVVLEDALGRRLRVRQVNGGEFRRVVKPEERVDVRLRRTADDVYLATLAVGDAPAAKFSLTVEPA